jgi:hypothetical protein
MVFKSSSRSFVNGLHGQRSFQLLSEAKGHLEIQFGIGDEISEFLGLKNTAKYLNPGTLENLKD